MKKTTLSVISILLGLFFLSPDISSAEVIKNFSVGLTVLPDSSLIVNERITYDFEDSLRRGIYRTIPRENDKGQSIEVSVISVTDDESNKYKFETSIKDDSFYLRIGDESKIISGVKIYNIKYKVRGAVGYFEDFDEIYWNVTGNAWNVPILGADATVVFPDKVFPKERKCYVGKIGSKTPCEITDNGIFVVRQELSKKEGLTIAVSFEKGSLAEYHYTKEKNSFWSFAKSYWPVVIPLAVSVFMFLRWFKKGRDPKGRGIIKAQYEAPKDLSPIEAGGILHESIRTKSISAEIIDLAIRGFIKIKLVDENVLGFGYSKDYELSLVREIGHLPDEFDKNIIKALFGDYPSVGGVVKISTLNKLFYKSIPEISGSVIDSLLKKKLYFNFPKNLLRKTLTIVIAIFAIFFSITIWVWTPQDFQNPKNLVIYFASLIVSISLTITFNLLMPSKTKKGVWVKECLLGLKEYLEIAEKDRLAFHNAPEKKPEVFERLLPYAIVFGVEDLWAKEFEGVYTSEPDWYQGGQAHFSASRFGVDLMVFNSIASSSFVTTPDASSGSSGTSGGSSGGGSGGGGGGSW